MNAPVHLLLLTFLCWSTLSGPSVAQDTGGSGEASPSIGTDKPATKKALSEDQMADLKFSHYEVSVSRTTYRPYIVTVSGEKLIQLEYDTMEEAQARIREAKKDNEILSPAWRDKDFGIETIVYKSTDTVFPSSLQKIAKRLATLKKYKPEKERTH